MALVDVQMKTCEKDKFSSDRLESHTARRAILLPIIETHGRSHIRRKYFTVAECVFWWWIIRAIYVDYNGFERYLPHYFRNVSSDVGSYIGVCYLE